MGKTSYDTVYTGGVGEIVEKKSRFIAQVFPVKTEEEVMQLLWEHGPILISKLVELYPDPKPHFNTVSTVVRRLETKDSWAITK